MSSNPPESQKAHKESRRTPLNALLQDPDWYIRKIHLLNSNFLDVGRGLMGQVLGAGVGGSHPPVSTPFGPSLRRRGAAAVRRWPDRVRRRGWNRLRRLRLQRLRLQRLRRRRSGSAGGAVPKGVAA